MRAEAGPGDHPLDGGLDDGPDAHLEGALEPEVGAELSLRSLSQTVRVELSRLDHLMNLIGELGVVQANVGNSLDVLRDRTGVTDVVRGLQTHLRSMARKLALLQQGILDVRMVPLGQVFDKLARVVRKLGREAGKDIRLGISGADTELDKLIVEELSDPLMHMIRNCIDHGIEPRRSGAPPARRPPDASSCGRSKSGNRVVIEVEDDGRGIDWRRDPQPRRAQGDDARRPRARELGMQEVIDLSSAPGFTTKETATAVSGRGVGMDVVKTNIGQAVSGMIDVDTSVGRGTTLSITLPVTLAIIQALVVETAGQTFCMPLNSVLESIMVEPSGRAHRRGTRGDHAARQDPAAAHLAPICGLFGLHGPGRPRGPRDPERIYVVVVGLAQHRVGLVVDELRGQQDVVIKSLGQRAASVPGIAGATELGGGRTVLLLDVAVLVEEALARGGAGRRLLPRVAGGDAAWPVSPTTCGRPSSRAARRSPPRRTTSTATPARYGGDLQQYVAFGVGPELYGLPIAEIGGDPKPLETTPVPRTAELRDRDRQRARQRDPGGGSGPSPPSGDHRALAGHPGAHRPTAGRALRPGGRRVVGVVPIAPEDLEDAPGAIAGPRGGLHPRAGPSPGRDPHRARARDAARSRRLPGRRRPAHEEPTVSEPHGRAGRGPGLGLGLPGFLGTRSGEHWDEPERAEDEQLKLAGFRVGRRPYAIDIMRHQGGHPGPPLPGATVPHAPRMSRA